MRNLLGVMASAFLLANLTAGIPAANAAMMHHMMKHHGKHASKCRGEFMMMDKKTGHCMDARN